MIKYLFAAAVAVAPFAAHAEIQCQPRQELAALLTGAGVAAFAGTSEQLGLLEVWTNPGTREWVSFKTKTDGNGGGVSCYLDGGTRYVDEHGGSLTPTRWRGRLRRL